MMNTVYARKESTLDKQVWHLKKQKMDIAFYSDEKATSLKGLIPWHRNHFTRRNKLISMSGMKYRLIWLPDLNERIETSVENRLEIMR